MMNEVLFENIERTIGGTELANPEIVGGMGIAGFL
jgi:hypothetical protein